MNAIRMKPRSIKTCNVRINVTPRRVRVTVVAFEGVSNLSEQARNVHRTYYIVVCYLSKEKIKGEMEVARRRGRRRKKLLDDLKDRRGYSHLKEEALDRTMWRHRSGGGFGPVVRQNTE